MTPCRKDIRLCANPRLVSCGSAIPPGESLTLRGLLSGFGGVAEYIPVNCQPSGQVSARMSALFQICLDIYFLILSLRSLKPIKEVYFTMLIIDSKDCENIDKALKKYKKKFEKAKILLQLRGRQSFTKPSIKRRGEVLKAIYKQNIAIGKIEPK